MKISQALQDLRDFPPKNSSSFIRVKSTSAFHLPELYLGLKKPNLPQNTNPKIIFTSRGLFACFPYSWIALKSPVIIHFPDFSDCCAIFIPQCSKTSDI